MPKEVQTSWPGYEDGHGDKDPWGNIYCTWVERNGHKYCNKMFLCPWGKPMDVNRQAAASFHSNVMVPVGWLYVCAHCGSRRMDKYGLSAFSDEDEFDPYVWGPECIANAVLVSEEEYEEGRRRYESARLRPSE